MAWLDKKGENQSVEKRSLVRTKEKGGFIKDLSLLRFGLGVIMSIHERKQQERVHGKMWASELASYKVRQAVGGDDMVFTMIVGGQ